MDTRITESILDTPSQPENLGSELYKNRHTTKYQLGQFHTTNVDKILKGYEPFVKGMKLIDPFAGNWDLLKWGQRSRSKLSSGYDIDPKNSFTNQRDCILNPPDYSGKFLITNPPFLGKSNAPNKDVFRLYDTDNLWKCFLKTITNPDTYSHRYRSSPDEGILILPLSFLFEIESGTRDAFFASFSISKMTIFEHSVFDDVKCRVIAFHFFKDARTKDCVRIPTTVVSDDFANSEKFQCELTKKHGWRCGEELFQYIDLPTHTIQFNRWDGWHKPNSKLQIELMDSEDGMIPIHMKYVENPSIHFYTIARAHIVMNIAFTEDQQRRIVEIFNEKMTFFRNKYHSLFLSRLHNRKARIPLSLVYSLLAAIIEKEILPANSQPS